MQSKELVSVIMPAYNASNYIEEAIASVVVQTYVDWELIIVDDGSTDTTAEKVQTWLEKESRIQYYYQDNGKQGKARNLGISKSKGEYLAFLDADDLWMPEKLEIQIEQIKQNNIDLVFSDSYRFVNKEVMDVSRRMNVKTTFFSGKKALQLFLEANRIPILTVLVKKEKVEAVGCFSESMDIQNAEDYHLWLKLLISNAKFYSFDAVLAKYRLHNNSVTAQDKLATNKLLYVYIDLLKLYPLYKKELEQELKSKFKIIYKTNLFTKTELAVWIKKNINYLSKSKLNYVYLGLNLFLPTKVTKRLLMYLLNE
jgi:teichuronic acid biosynthesis glycosyltransferase TuaG